MWHKRKKPKRYSIFYLLCWQRMDKLFVKIVKIEMFVSFLLSDMSFLFGKIHLTCRVCYPWLCTHMWEQWLF